MLPLIMSAFQDGRGEANQTCGCVDNIDTANAANTWLYLHNIEWLNMMNRCSATVTINNFTFTSTDTNFDYIADKVTGLDQVWLHSDNFAATTYRKYFLEISGVQEQTAKFDFYIKTNFDFDMFCNSRYNSPTQNMLVRIQNTVANAINKHIALSRYFLVILDDDLITYLDFKGPGVAELLRKWVSWLIDQMTSAVAERKKQLPIKSKREAEPCIYWCLVPTHKNFSQPCNDTRKKLNFCLESLLKGKQDMRVIKLKEHWDFADQSLVCKDNMTDTGLYSYWKAIDAAF